MKVKPHPRAGAAHQRVDRAVAKRRTDLPRPQVHEHVVGIDQPVLLSHVQRVQPHQLIGHDRKPARALPPRAVSVVLPRHQLHPPLPRAHVLMPQTQRLRNTHPRLRQQREQEPVAQPPLHSDHGHDLRQRQHLRQLPHRPQPTDPRARGLLRDPIQKRPIGPPAATAVLDQRRRDRHTMTSVKLIKAHHRRQRTIGRAR